MSYIRSPFLVIQDFISPKMCDSVLSQVEIKQPDVDKEDKPIKMERHQDELENILFSRFKEFIPSIEERYNAKYRATEKLVFQYYPENSSKPAEQPGCESSKFIRRKWVKTRDVDLTGILWLKDYNNNVPLDPRTETYGGKLEFPVYNFSLVPQRGTLVLFPAGPHFICAISPILVSPLYQVKFNVCISEKNGGMWFYQPARFLFDEKLGPLYSWFNDYI
jgi:hypothetical protein